MTKKENLHNPPLTANSKREDVTLRVFVQLVHDKTQPIDRSLLDPHYTDDRFRNGAQTVFLSQGKELVCGYGGTKVVEGASYDYSDRIYAWFDKNERNDAWLKAREEGHAEFSAGFYEAYLRFLYKNPELELVHITSGVNRGNGYPYRVYGYLSSNDKSA